VLSAWEKRLQKSTKKLSDPWRIVESISALHGEGGQGITPDAQAGQLDHSQSLLRR